MKDKENKFGVIIIAILSLIFIIISVDTDIFGLLTTASIYENRPIHVCSYSFDRVNKYNNTIGGFKYNYYPIGSVNDCTYGSAITSYFVPVNADTETVMKTISQEIGNQIVEYNGVTYQHSPTPSYTISIQSNVNGAPTYLNGVYIGSSSQNTWLSVSRPPGDYTISIIKLGYYNYTNRITAYRDINITAYIDPIPAQPLPSLPTPPLPTYQPPHRTQPANTPGLGGVFSIFIFITLYLYKKKTIKT